LFVHRCHVLNVIFLFGVSCFLPVGSRVDVSNESDVKINNTDDQYFSINEQVKKKNPGDLYSLVINNKASSPPPSEPMVSKYFKTYYFATYGSTIFYR
jgi:hypothetical protein